MCCCFLVAAANGGIHAAVCIGANEKAGFLRQHKAFFDARASAARPLTDASIAGENHIIEHLAKSDGPLFQTVSSQAVIAGE